MKVEHTPVTGREHKDRLTPQMKSLCEFYQALNNRDLELMAQNWARTDEAVMDNPLGVSDEVGKRSGPLTSGCSAAPGIIGSSSMTTATTKQGGFFYVVGRERGEYSAGETMLKMAIRTTRVFRRIDGEWRQVHHHGSIDEPGLLAAYQQAVKPNS